MQKKYYVTGAVVGATAATLTSLIVIPKLVKKVRTNISSKRAKKELEIARKCYDELVTFSADLEDEYGMVVETYQNSESGAVRNSSKELANIFVEYYKATINEINDLCDEWGFEPVEEVELAYLL